MSCVPRRFTNRYWCWCRQQGCPTAVSSCLGCLAAGQGKLQRAARLLAAAEDNIPGVFGCYPRTEFERDVTSVRTRLGETTFASAWAAGKAMTWEQSIAYALQQDNSSSHSKP